MGQFAVTLTESTSYDFGGRTVAETFPNGQSDTCYVPNNFGIQPFVPNPASPFKLYDDNGNLYTDSVGIEPNDPDIVEFYRQRNRAPCGFYTTQKATIDTPSGPYVYQTNAMSIVINDKTVVVTRGNLSSPPLIYGTSQSAYRGVTAIITSLLLGPHS